MHSHTHRAAGNTLLSRHTGPTKFLVGTEQGIILAVNMRKKTGGGGASIGASAASSSGPIATVTPQDNGSTSATSSLVPGKHHGPITSLQRNPAATTVYASAGDWGVRIWTEKIRSPIIVLPYAPAIVTAVAWSPTRPAVLFATRTDGVLDIWDLLYRYVA